MSDTDMRLASCAIGDCDWTGVYATHDEATAAVEWHAHDQHPAVYQGAGVAGQPGATVHPHAPRPTPVLVIPDTPEDLT